MTTAPGAGGPAAADRTGSPARRERRWRGLSLRLRLTVLTAAAVAATLVVGAVALTGVLSRSRVAALDGLLRDRITVVTGLVDSDTLPGTLPTVEAGEVAQLLDAAGGVLASSPNASRTLPVLPSDQVAALRSRAGAGVLLVTTTDDAYSRPARAAVRAVSYRGQPATVVVSMPLGEVQGLLSALRVALLIVVPLLTVLVGLALWFAVGRALHPVDQLRRAAAQVAASGGGGGLPVPAADDELAALARTLNEMLDRLDRAASRQRTFVADAAHELRSPLTALRATVDVARSHPAGWTVAELAAEIEPEALRMQALVDDLLLLARVGARPARGRSVDLRALADDLATDGRVPVEVRGNGSAFADPERVGRVLRNLVDNAVRHAASRVRVVVRQAGGSCTVTVEDDGNGVPVADRERVFERFVRLDEAREREAGGSGLGLAIARELAREQGGDVTLGDGELGGLAATVRLPAASGGPGPRPTAPHAPGSPPPAGPRSHPGPPGNAAPQARPGAG